MRLRLLSSQITRADVDECTKIAKFLMNCGEYNMALDIITFYLYSFSLLSNRPQIPKTHPTDLFQDRYLNLLWGRLACELLLGNTEDAQQDIRSIETYLKSNEVPLSICLHSMSVPASQLVQERTWLIHYGLFLFAQHPEGVDLFYRNFMNKEYSLSFKLTLSYLSVMEMNCPWVLRYAVVIILTQGKQNRHLLSRIAEIVDRSDEPVVDPLLLFIYHMVIHMDFVSAAKQFAQAEDVFASDFFLASRGAQFEEVGV